MQALVDAIAAEFAFYEPALRPLVELRTNCSRLTFDVVNFLRGRFAPTASLLSTIKAIVKFWPQPAAVIGGRASVALRVTPYGHNAAASQSGLKFIPTKRVPQGSPVRVAHETAVNQDEFERLGNWSTSQAHASHGSTSIPPRGALVSVFIRSPKRLAEVSVFVRSSRLG